MSDRKDVKPIETRYNGHRFRSRLEARWAVFFDHMYIAWQYEQEGYRTPDGPYLPDFFLPRVNLRTTVYGKGILVECKPTSPTEKEQSKLRHVAEAKDMPAGILVGPPAVEPMDHLQIAPDWDNYMVFVHCTKCNRVKYEFSESNYMWCENCQIRASDKTPHLIRAVEAANTARFEFGESGR